MELTQTKPTSTPSLRRLAIRGSVWTIAGYGSSQVLRLAGNLILTRLLFPKAFGVMALISVFQQGLEMFSDIGIVASIVQNEKGNDPSFLNTAWTINIMRGFVLWLVSCLIAYPVAQFYGEPLLAQMLPVAGLTSFIAGFNSTALFTALRHLSLGRLNMVEVGSYSIGLVAMIALAAAHPTVWALVIGGLVASVSKMVMSHLLLPGERHRVHWNRSAASAIVRFGRWIFLSTAAGFLATCADRLFLGRYLTMDSLGLYSIAFFLSSAPEQAIKSIANQVMFPVFSRVAQQQPSSLRDVYYRSRLYLDGLSLPLAGMLIMAGSLVINLLYDARFVGAGWMLQVLSIRIVFAAVTPPASVCLFALGKPQFASMANFLQLVWLFIGIPLGWHLSGLTGAVWVIALSCVPTLPVYWIALARRRLLLLRREGLALLMLGAGMMVGYLITRLAGHVHR